MKNKDDERIIDHIIQMLEYYSRYSNYVTKAFIDQDIAWLKEHKINTEGDFARGYDCGYECCLNSHGAEWLEKNRLAACDAQTREEYERETDFVDKFIAENQRTPTFSDAINYGIAWQKEKMMKEAVESEAEELYNDGEIQCTVSVGTYFKPGDKVYVLKAEEE